jgi:hypothetical protein
MKKLMRIFIVASLGVIAVACESYDEKVVSEGKLPQAARDFISMHFPDQSITRVVMDTDMRVDYNVRLDNGFNLEFNKAGEWRDVEGNGMEIPESLQAELPDGIVTYVETNHDGQAISTVELNNSRYEVDLTSGVELVFNQSGEFVRYDD